jgi:hypothetical protein
MEHDLSLWGIFAMPVGLLVCFGPALLVWIKAELRDASAAKKARR